MLNFKEDTSPKSKKMISYHSLARTVQTLEKRLEENKAIMQALENNELSHDLTRHHSMAKVYIVGAILELRKMCRIKEQETSQAFYSKKN